MNQITQRTYATALSFVLLFTVSFFTLACGEAGDSPGPAGGPTACTVSFDPGEGSGTPPASQTVNSGTSVTLPGQGNMTAPDGKIFNGWTAANSVYAAGTSYTVSADILFTALWVIQAANPPEAPTGLRAEAESSGSIKVSWTAVSGADSYRVYFAAGASASFTPAPDGTVTGTSYTHTGLQAGTTCFYYATAVNSAGESGHSSTVSATTVASGNDEKPVIPGVKPAIPGVPTGVTATAYSDTSVLVTWNAVPDALGYRVYYENADASPPTKTVSTGGAWEGETGYYVGNLTPNTTCNFYVTSLYWDTVSNSQAESDYSASGDSARATTMSEPPPLPGDPSNVQAAANSPDTVTVTWSPGANAFNYEVSYSVPVLDDNDNVIDYEEIGAKTTTGASITITGLKSRTSYYFEVIAVNAAGRSPGFFGVGASCTTESEPIAISAAAQSASSILVTWDEAAWVASYTLYYREGSGSIYNTIVEGASYLHTGLSAGRTYYYYIRATDRWGQYEESDTVSASIVPAPTGLTTTAGTGISNRVSWTAVTGATGYKVEYREGSSGEWTPVQEPVTTASYTHSGLTEGVTYYYRVKAVMNGSESGYSETVSRTAGPMPVPATPSGVTATAQSSSSIRVTWNASSSGGTPASYNIWRSSSASGTYTQIGTVSGTTLSYTNTGLSASTTYYYKVDAENSAGRSVQSSYGYATTQSAAPTTYAPYVQSISGTKSGDTLTISWSFVTGTGYSAPTSIRFRLMNPDNSVWGDVTTLSGSATSYSFNYLPWKNSDGDVYLGITGTNTAGSGSGGLIYRSSTNTWVRSN